MSIMKIFIYTIIAIFTIIIFLILFYRFVFLRDPKRIIPKGKGLILSPADGVVGEIIRVKGNELDNLGIDKGLTGKIKIFAKDVGPDVLMVPIIMNVFNVHLQRSPVDATVVETKYSKGKFTNVVFEKERFRYVENEHNEILFKAQGFNIKVVQIAGLLARRIVCTIKKGDKVSSGQKFGLIKLGSKVCLLFPASFKLLVKKGDKVTAGETVISRVYTKHFKVVGK